MDSESINSYFGFLPVINTVEDRLIDDSLTHTFSQSNKTRNVTHKLNQHLKTARIQSYTDFKQCKQQILSKIKDNLDVTDDSDVSDSDFKTFYSSFLDTNAEKSTDIHDDLFVWSYVKKKGLKSIEPEEKNNNPMWEPTINIEMVDDHNQVEGQVNFNASFKAAGALPITSKYLKMRNMKKIKYNTRKKSLSENSNDDNANSINSSNDTPKKNEEKDVEKIKTPNPTVLRNMKINSAKRNLKSAINNVRSQASETSEVDNTCDFASDDFQAQSTQIFSDTFMDTSIQKSNRLSQIRKSSSNTGNNQPRDSGIDEDSRDENSIHQNIANSNRAPAASKKKNQNNLLNGNTEFRNDSKKAQSLKIIGDQTLTKKYKIISKNNKGLQPIVEEKNVQLSECNNKTDNYSNQELDDDSGSSFKSIETEDEEESVGLQPIVEEKNVQLSEFNNKTDNYSNQQLDDDSGSSFKSIETEDEEESVGREKAKESCDEDLNEYHNAPDDHDAESLENEKVSEPEPEQIVVKHRSTKTDEDEESDFENSRHHTQRIKYISSRSPSPWIAKQYNDLKRMRLLDSSQDESENVSSEKSESGSVIEQKASKKSKKAINKHDKTGKVSEEHSKSSKEKSFINAKLMKNLNTKKVDPTVTNETFDEDAAVEKKSKKNSESSCDRSKNDKSSNSKLDSNNRNYSESDSAGTRKSSQKLKKLKKKKQKISEPDLPSSTEQSCERQEDLVDVGKSSKIVYSSKSSKDVSEDDDFSDLPVLKLSQQKVESFHSDSEDSNENIVATCSKKNSSRRDSNTSSRKDLVTSNKSNLKIESFVSTDEEKESDDEKTMSQHQKKKLQKLKKMNLMASDESSSSEMEVEKVEENKNKSSRKEATKSNEKIVEKSSESDDSDNDDDHLKTIAPIIPHNKSQSIERDKDDDILPTQQAQEKIQKMKRLKFDGSSESEDSEIETFTVNKHKSQFVRSQASQEQNIVEKSVQTQKPSNDDTSDEEDEISENQIKKLLRMKKMDLIANYSSLESDEEDHISKIKSIKKSPEKVKSQDSEDEDKTSEKNVKLQKNDDADLRKEQDSDDSDDIDIKEHTVILPDELKYSNLLDHFKEYNADSSENKSEMSLDKTNVDELEDVNDDDIDNIVPVEVSKRMQQLKRLNLYDDNESSDSDESLRNNRNNKNPSQNPPSVSTNDGSSDEKESINEEPSISTSKLDEPVPNDTKESIEDNGEEPKENSEKNMNVIIPETQESEDLMSDNIQSQDMFMSYENLAECPTQAPATLQSFSKKSSPAKPPREKVTRIDELVEQEQLIKSSLEATITLDDISDDEDIFLLEVPKNIFDENVVGKKLVVTNSTITIGKSHYEARKKDISPIISCVIKSKKNKYKTVNIRPLVAITARRKRNIDDFDDDNTVSEKRAKTPGYSDENVEKSSIDVGDAELTTNKPSKLKKSKTPKKDKLHSLSSTTLKDGTITKKKVAQKQTKLNNFVVRRESFEENTGHEVISTSKGFKRTLYSSDNEVKDIVDNNATDSSMSTNNSAKKSKKSKKVKDNVNENEFKHPGEESGVVYTSKTNIENDVDVLTQSKSKTKSKKKTKTEVEKSNSQAEENVMDNIVQDTRNFEDKFRDSFRLNMSHVEEVKPVKKKAKKRKIAIETSEDINVNTQAKKRKKSNSEEEQENSDVKPKKTKKKVEKRKEEPAAVQTMKFMKDQLNLNADKPEKKSKKSKKVKDDVNENEFKPSGEESGSTSKTKIENDVDVLTQSKSKTKSKKKTKTEVEKSNSQTEEDVIDNIMEDSGNFEDMFRDSYLLRISSVEDVEPVKKKPKKRKKKVKKSKGEPAHVQMLNFLNDHLNVNGKKLNTSTSSNESRYGALNIERQSFVKKKFLASDSSDESDNKYNSPKFQIRDNSKEKELQLTKSTTSSSSLVKKDVKDEKKKVKKVYFDE